MPETQLPPPTRISSIGNNMSAVSGTLGVLSQAGLLNGIPGMAMALPGLGLVTGGLGIFSGVFNMARNGASLGGILQTGMALGGVLMSGAAITMAAASATAAATSAAAMTAFTGAMMSGNIASAGMIAAGATTASSTTFMASMVAFATNPVTLGIVIAVVAFAIIMGLLGPDPTAAELAMNAANQQLVWSTGLMLAIPMTTLLATMILGNNPNRASSHPATISADDLRARLPVDSVGINGPSRLPGEAIPYGVPLLIVDANGRVTRVAIASRNGLDASGNGRASVQTYDLDKKYIFAAPDPDSPTKYISLMIGRNVNPKAVDVIETQRSLITACLSGALTATQCTTALTIASAANKDVEAVPVN